jgi:hypothetical protein
MEHYVMGDGECRPFLITRKWNDDMVNGTLFIDGRNDYLSIPYWVQPTGMSPSESVLTVWRTSVHLSEESHEPNTWHHAEI